MKTDTVDVERRPVADYLASQYTFNVIADEQGGYVIVFPDLPGCLTQVDTVGEIPAAVEDVRRLWIESEYERGREIPWPSYPPAYSGKFNLRIGRSLHRRLVESAEREGLSLNQYALSLLERAGAAADLERRVEAIERVLPSSAHQNELTPKARAARR